MPSQETSSHLRTGALGYFKGYGDPARGPSATMAPKDACAMWESILAADYINAEYDYRQFVIMHTGPWGTADVPISYYLSAGRDLHLRCDRCVRAGRY